MINPNTNKKSQTHNASDLHAMQRVIYCGNCGQPIWIDGNVQITIQSCNCGHTVAYDGTRDTDYIAAQKGGFH